jgi:hypothetical protein
MMKSLYSECEALVGSIVEDSVYVFAESCLYLTGVTGAFEFQNHIRRFAETKSPKAFRLILRSSRYSNLDIKMFVLNLGLMKDQTRYKHIAKTLGINPIDAKLLTTLYTENAWFKKSVNTYIRKNGYHISDVDFGTINETFTRIYPDVLKYIKHITFKKLRFLVKSTNSEMSEYHSELSTKLVQAFYSIMPTKMSEGHLKNYLKRIVHNHAINMIESGVTKKRGRMISTQNVDGSWNFSMLCQSQNQLSLPDGLNAEDFIEGVDNSSDLFEIRFSISEVLDKSTPTNYKFLTLLLGEEDALFSDYLRRRGYCRDTEDNVDVQNRIEPESYTKLISEFLRVSNDKVSALFDSLRNQLAWC